MKVAFWKSYEQKYEMNKSIEVYKMIINASEKKLSQKKESEQ